MASGKLKNATKGSSISKKTPESPKLKRRWWVAVSCAAVAIITVAVAVILNISHQASDATKILKAIDVDNGDLKINWERYPVTEVKLSETLTIAKSGTYRISGMLENGAIKVDAGVGEVKLILEDVAIHNDNGPAIYCASAEDLVIELIGDNSLIDGAAYSNDYDIDVSGTVYSVADLTFQGDGKLTIKGEYQDAIVGKNDVKFNSGVYKLSALDDGIRGRDSVHIAGGTLDIDAGADGIKSTNADNAGKGFIMIEAGEVRVNALAKGIKSTNSILISGGSSNITSRDDAIHSNNYIGIIGGELTVKAGDDGIHANRELIMDGGNVIVDGSYEGMEAQAITINGGEITISASDDGMNAGGGSDTTANHRPGAGPFDVDTNCVLTFNGGNTYINASGDGVDSNGYLYFNGGSVTIDGPTNDSNGALDAGAGIQMQGGSVVAIGSSGMAMTLGENSNVFNLDVYFTVAQTAGTKIDVRDAGGQVLISHIAAKNFTHAAIGNDALEFGQTYSIYLNDVKYRDFTITSTTTTIGNITQNHHRLDVPPRK